MTSRKKPKGDLREAPGIYIKDGKPYPEMEVIQKGGCRPNQSERPSLLARLRKLF